jgi:hypothetical protein
LHFVEGEVLVLHPRYLKRKVSLRLEIISIVSLCAGLLSSLVNVFAVLAGKRQQMWIMNVAWPITAWYSGPLGLLAYYKPGRLSTQRQTQEAKEQGKQPPVRRKPFWQSVAIGATHCGRGCSLGDILAEWFIFFVPITLFGRKVFATWMIDYLLAFLFGIAFQYFTIKPMRNLSVAQDPLSADSLASRYVWLGGFGHFRHFPLRNPQDKSCFLVHDADCHAGRIFNKLPR